MRQARPVCSASAGALVPSAASDRSVPGQATRRPSASHGPANGALACTTMPCASASSRLAAVDPSVAASRSSSRQAASRSARVRRRAESRRNAETRAMPGASAWPRPRAAQRIHDCSTASLTRPVGRTPSPKQRSRARAMRACGVAMKGSCGSQGAGGVGVSAGSFEGMCMAGAPWHGRPGPRKRGCFAAIAGRGSRRTGAGSASDAREAQEWKLPRACCSRVSSGERR
jgi:hypothetical protein